MMAGSRGPAALILLPRESKSRAVVPFKTTRLRGVHRKLSNIVDLASSSQLAGDPDGSTTYRSESIGQSARRAREARDGDKLGRRRCRSRAPARSRRWNQLFSCHFLKHDNSGAVAMRSTR